jgi:hypothetical protein
MKNQYLLKFTSLMLLTIGFLSACSIGTSRVTLPDLSDVNLSTAESTLLELNLIPFYITKYDDNVPKGKIIDTIPEAYSRVDAFSRVQLIVSDGPRELISTFSVISYNPNERFWHIPKDSIEMIFADKPKIIDGILEINLIITFDKLSGQWADKDNDGFGDGYFVVKDGFEESLRLPLTLESESLDISPGIPQTLKLRFPLKSLGLQTAYNLEINLIYIGQSGPFRDLRNINIRLDW